MGKSSASATFASRLLLATLALNIVLATWLLFSRRQPTPVSSPAVMVASPAEVDFSVASIPFPNPEVKFEKGISWVSLKDKDTRQLVQNLRRIQTPEYVIQDLALNSLEVAVGASTPKLTRADFWLIGSQAHLARNARENLRIAAEQSNRVLLRDLFGFVPDRELKHDMVNDPEILFVLGFIPDPRLEQILSELKYIVEFNQKQEGSISKSLEVQHTLACYREVLRMASAQLSPNDVEEGRLRGCMYLAAMVSNEISAVGLSGYQARELLRTLFRDKDPIEDLIRLEGNGSQLLQIDSPASASLVTPDQRLKLQRIANPELNQAFVFAEKAHLSTDIAVKVHEMTRAARTEMEAVPENFLLEENQTRNLAEIKRLTRDAIQKIIPPSALEFFDTDYGDFRRGAP
jgi:hypothetical protein